MLQMMTALQMSTPARRFMSCIPKQACAAVARAIAIQDVVMGLVGVTNVAIPASGGTRCGFRISCRTRINQKKVEK